MEMKEEKRLEEVGAKMENIYWLGLYKVLKIVAVSRDRMPGPGSESPP